MDWAEPARYCLTGGELVERLGQRARQRGRGTFGSRQWQRPADPVDTGEDYRTQCEVRARRGIGGAEFDMELAAHLFRRLAGEDRANAQAGAAILAHNI